MKKVKRAVGFMLMLIVIWNIVVVASCFVLDKIDPYYATMQTEDELTKDELLAVCPDALISELDKKFLLSVLNDSTVLNELPLLEHGDMLWLSEEDCSRIISQYEDAPGDICRISVSRSNATMSEVTYVCIEFYETEDDKGSTPSTAYPCICLNLRASKSPEYNAEDLTAVPFIYSYRKELYNYTFKVADDRIGTSSWGGPDAAYHRYACEVSPYGDMFDCQEKTLTPMKHRHLYLKYFGWFEAMMSV